eukprot:3234389-Amphidinium_carterae.1
MSKTFFATLGVLGAVGGRGLHNSRRSGVSQWQVIFPGCRGGWRRGLCGPVSRLSHSTTAQMYGDFSKPTDACVMQQRSEKNLPSRAPKSPKQLEQLKNTV